jgi:hypothetical protein
VSGGDAFVDDVRTDEARTAGHKDAHGNPGPTTQICRLSRRVVKTGD